MNEASTGTCSWALGSDEMRRYHDEEWGVPSRDDRYLFELITLEGAQAGLSWSTILKRRDGYRTAFANFDVAKVARFTDARIEKLMQDEGVIRHRAKLLSVRTNAKAFIAVQREFGSFADYLWGWVDGEPVINHPKTMAQVPATTDLATAISKDLKKRGFSFVGPTIIQAYLQATGVINDHVVTCPAKRG